jgi:hypothetical protein
MPSHLVTAAGLVLLGVACARPQGVRPSAAAAVPDSVFIEVVNDNYYDARLHLIYDGGGRYALGTVGGNGRQPVAAFPWEPRPLLVEVTLIVGGGVYRSDRIDVAKGDVLQIRVPVNLDASGFFRRVSR